MFPQKGSNAKIYSMFNLNMSIRRYSQPILFMVVMIIYIYNMYNIFKNRKLRVFKNHPLSGCSQASHHSIMRVKHGNKNNIPQLPQILGFICGIYNHSQSWLVYGIVFPTIFIHQHSIKTTATKIATKSRKAKASTLTTGSLQQILKGTWQFFDDILDQCICTYIYIYTICLFS